MSSKMPLFIKPIALAVALGSVTLLPADPAAAQEAAVGQVITLTAKVVAIDKENRTLSLKGEEGEEITVEAGEQAINFDQIEVGDTLNAGYMESVEVFLDQSGSAPDMQAEEVAERAEKGEKPGGVIGRSMLISAKVTEVDKKSRVLTLELEDGSEVEKQVDPSIAAFDQIKKGDTIGVRMTRILVVDVSKVE
jgi:hypothetical protein